MKTPIGWALIGASNVAREWMIDAIRSQPDASLRTVFSRDAKRGQEFATAHDIPNSTSELEDVLQDPSVHVVYVSSRNELHRDQVLAAARAGKHVLCEKPLALSLTDAEEMVRVCHESGIILGTNHHLRCSAVHIALRHHLKTNAIGELNTVRVFHANFLAKAVEGWRLNDAAGGLILDSTIHDIDTLRFLLGADPIDVFAMTQSGRRSVAGIEDGLMAVMRFPGDVLVQIHGSYAVPYAPGGVELYGENAALIARDCMSQKPIGSLSLRDGDGERPISIEHHNLYRYSVRHFCDSVAGHGSPAATGEDGVASLKIALALKESVQSGHQVKVSQS
ncbi:1,5-anhydro-D-fructose reductase (1,5-anhydro-D-mannitol-forming) [Gluconobacter cerinus]|uniref:Gfo/Idh/MocA family protein n=1 Tax=Gluconobacter cerinus TaxID=38307 RepID=UPI002227F799|nr:Gfo/Idh/MocA family oxidoreductase [Gluconobacter cerinus]MCW2266774.1 1,5-anhydro-D-fructose reductase (1,5-anhydro-D-mannitol-forming) [Gluconobacter cerinus]